jgi:hypothetical protein
MITLIWAVFRGSWMLQAATAALIANGAFKANNAYQLHKGGQAVIAKCQTAVKAANAKALKSHAAARGPGAAQRLLSTSCRDWTR